MRIAILGGTGTLGEGLTLRLARDTTHELVVGSRDAGRARDAAAAYESTLAERKIRAGPGGATTDPSIDGLANGPAVEDADVVVLSVPPKYARSTVEEVEDALEPGTALVSPAVPMARGEAGFGHDAPRTADSLTALVARAAPSSVSVVGAYHALPAERLADLDDELDYDVPIVGDDDAAVETVVELTDQLDGLRGLAAGGLGVAATVESLTPLLLNVGRENDCHDVGPRFH